MTLTMHQRVLGIVKGLQTEDEYLISAVLGIEPADVARALKEPSYEPSAPGGSVSPLAADPPQVAFISLSVTLDTGNGWWHRFSTADLAAAIGGGDWQTGAALSVADDPAADSSHGAIFTSEFGVYQAAAAVQPSNSLTLDGSSSKQRFLWFGLQVGRQQVVDAPVTSNVGGMGIDLVAPVVAEADDPNGVNQAIAVSTPGWIDVNDTGPFRGLLLRNMALSAIAPHGTDSIPVSISLAIYRIA